MALPVTPLLSPVWAPTELAVASAANATASTVIATAPARRLLVCVLLTRRVCMSPSPRKLVLSVEGILAHRANRWKSLHTRGRTMQGMAVVESAENQGAWEQRRVQVALRIELAGLQLIG